MNSAYYDGLMQHKRSILLALLEGASKLGPPVLTEHTYKAGQTIFYSGNEPFGVYFIQHGMVKLLKSGKSGRMHITFMGGPGDLFGYRALLAGELYKVTAESHQNSKVSFIKGDFFLEYLRTNADLCHLLLKTLSVELAEVEDRLVGAAQVSASHRVAWVLCFLMRTYGLSADNFLSMELSRTDMSELSDTAAETLMRCLKDLEKRKLIARDGKRIRIVLKEELLKEAGFSV